MWYYNNSFMEQCSIIMEVCKRVYLIQREIPTCKGGDESIFLFLPFVLWYNGNMKLYKAAHTVYKTQYHIVWITRYRRKILVTGVKSYLKIKLQEIRKCYPDWKYIEIGIKKDHVHLYRVIPPKYVVSKVVETIKKNTSRSLSRKFAFLKKYIGIEKAFGVKAILHLRLG